MADTGTLSDLTLAQNALLENMETMLAGPFANYATRGDTNRLHRRSCAMTVVQRSSAWRYQQHVLAAALDRL
jgi:hypothetical protein